MPHLESQLVAWVLESNAEGQWALFLRVSGQPTQVSRWYESRQEVVTAIAALFTEPEPPA